MRQALICVVLAAAASTALVPFARAQAREAPREIARDVVLVPGSFTPGRQPDGNSVLFVGAHGALAVDSGRHIEHTQALLGAATARQAPLRALLNTHWHLDHLGGNLLIRQRLPDVQVLASTAVGDALRGWLADSRRDMQALLDGGRADAATQAMLRIDLALIDGGSKLLPDQVIVMPRQIDVIGRPLSVGVARYAVTAADLWVFDPASRVLAAGDLVTFPVPFFDTACGDGWKEALALLEAQPFETLVPGHGVPLSRAEFQRWRGAFDNLLRCAAGSQETAACSAAWIADLGPLLPAAEHARARGMLGYYLQQHLRADGAKRHRFCPAPLAPR